MKENFVWFVLNKIPKVFKFFKDKGRINEVTKIDDATATGNDKFINDKLRSVIKKEENRRKANS